MFDFLPKSYSLRTKATLIVVAVVMVSLSLATGINIFQTNKLIEAEQKKSAESIVQGLAQAAELPLIVQDKRELDRLLDGFLWNDQVQFLLIYNSANEIVARRVLDEIPFDQFMQNDGSGRSLLVEQVILFQADTDFSTLDTVSPDSNRGNSKEVGKVLVALSLGAVRQAQLYQAFVSFIAACVAAAFGIFLIIKFIGDWTHRVDELVTAAESMKSGDFSQRVYKKGAKDEIGKLASAFEAMRKAVRQRDIELRELNDSLHDLVRVRTEKLESAMLEAQTANEAKSSFLANMSHEIRTPMNAIIGMVGLSLNKKLSPKLREYLLTVRSSAESLLAIINDILDFSKIEAGKIRLEQIDFQLHQLFDKLADLFSDQAASRNVELVIGIEPGIPVALRGDPLRLEQIFINLLGNAIKFTDKGIIFLHATLDSETDDKVRILFSVRDTGVGIVEEQYESLFDPFTQADGSMTREYGGTGLGLSICRRLVNLYGGEIWVDSAAGVGTTIFFTAEFARQPEGSEIQYVVPATIRGLNILVIDDNKTARCITTKMLESFHFRSDVVSSCAEAMILVEDRKDSYDLILVDWRMPEVDGIECVRNLKKTTAAGNVPIVMMTAFGGDREVMLAKEAGVGYFLTKPVKQSLLFDTIMDIFNYPEAMHASLDDRKPVTEMFGSEHLSGVRVLLAEDNRINQNVARELLESVGIIVEIANNGQEAVSILRDRGAEFDAVLMDIQMPVMDGFEATEIIRKNPALADLVVIAVTAHAMQGDRDRCMQAGMNDYVAKPITPELLFSVLTRWTRPDHIENISHAKATGFALLEQNEKFPESLPGLHVESGVARMAGNVKAYGRMLKDLLSFGGDTILRLPELVKEDIHLAIREVHTLKGTAGNLSAKQLQKISLEFELALREISENSDDDNIAEQSSQVLEHYVVLIELSLAELKSSLEALDSLCAQINTSAKCAPLEEVALEELLQILQQLQVMSEAFDPMAEDFWAEKKAVFQGKGIDEEMVRMENHLRNYNFERVLDFIQKIEQGLEGKG